MSLTRAYIEAVGLVAPGLTSWAQAQPVLRGEHPYQPQPLEALKPTLLPANERRRTTRLIKLALQSAEQVLAQTQLPSQQWASVFSSSEGDSAIVEKICHALTLPEKPVSPTLFHNSVHNAPAGYWAIAAQSRAYSTSLAAAESSFAAGLMETYARVVLNDEAVLLISYDESLAESFKGRSVVDQPLAVALLLTPAATSTSLAAMTLQPEPDGVEPYTGPLAELLDSNPAGRALPLLSALAKQQWGTLQIEFAQYGRLQLELQPC